MTHVCPDGGAGCWEPLKDLAKDMDVKEWLKAEMIDGLDHEYAHSVMGPAIFGFDDNEVPNFEVFRNENNYRWDVRAKPEYKPADLIGLIVNPFVNPAKDPHPRFHNHD